MSEDKFIEVNDVKIAYTELPDGSKYLSAVDVLSAVEKLDKKDLNQLREVIEDLLDEPENPIELSDFNKKLKKALGG